MRPCQSARAGLDLCSMSYHLTVVIGALTVLQVACSSKADSGSGVVAGAPATGPGQGGNTSAGGSSMTNSANTTASDAGGAHGGDTSIATTRSNGTGGGSVATSIGTSASDLGKGCTATCTLSPCATSSTICGSKSCLYEARFLPNQQYCTVSCSGSGATCPTGWDCVKDARQPDESWCVKGPPPPPADFGKACDKSFNVSTCLLQNPERECAQFGHGCEQWCVRGPGGAPAHCSTGCSATLPCPTDFDCRDNPEGATSDSVCFRSYAPADVIGKACEPDPNLARTCDAEQSSCVVSDRYGLCTCLQDNRDPAQRGNYCSLACDTSSCPAGFTCAAASGSGSTPAGKYCLRGL